MEYLIKVSAIIVIFYFCYNLFLQRDTFFESNRWFLLLGLITAFCIPFIVIPKYIMQASAPIQDFIFIEGSTTSNAINTSFDIMQIISLIYIIGFIFFFGRFLIQLYSLSLLLIQNKKQQYKRYAFVETLNDVSPFSFFKWIVYNPNQFSETELKQILNHEKVHARQWHSIDILFSQLTSVLLWFNPFIWLYKKNLEQNLEFIADFTANKKTDCKKSYQYLLLKASLPNYQMALTNNFYNSLIKKRIVMLHKNRSKNRNHWKFTLILPLLALFIMSFNTKEIIVTIGQNSTIDSIIETPEAIGDIIEVIISKDSKEADLKLIKADFKKVGVTLKFSGIKRNENNEIIDIKIEAILNNSKSVFKTNSDEPIKPIIITLNKERNIILIGSGSERHFVKGKDYSFFSKDDKHKIHKSGKGNNVFVFESDEENEHEHKDEHEDVFIIKTDGKVQKVKSSYKNENVHIIHVDDDKILKLDDSIHFGNIYINKVRVLSTDTLWIEKSGDVVREWVSDNNNDKNVWITADDSTFEIKTIGKGNNKLFISGDSEKQLLLFIDGKEASKKVFSELDPDTIDKIEVLKGDSATKEYGKKAKDGVVIITTKKKE